MVNIRERKSKIWKLWPILFPGTNMDSVVITFGRSIWTSSGDRPLYDLMIHELKHVQQQRQSYLYAIVWWIKYYFSKKFRYSQELEAYGEQLKYLSMLINGTTKDRNMRLHQYTTSLRRLAYILSHPMYGSIVTYEKAEADLKAIVPWTSKSTKKKANITKPKGDNR